MRFFCLNNVKMKHLKNILLEKDLVSYRFKVRLHWRDFARDFALACTFSKENKLFLFSKTCKLNAKSRAKFASVNAPLLISNFFILNREIFTKMIRDFLIPENFQFYIKILIFQIVPFLISPMLAPYPKLCLKITTVQNYHT